VINTNLPPRLSYLAPFPSYGWLLVKFSLTRGEYLTLTLSLEWSPANIAINDISLKTSLFGLLLRCRKYWCVFNHFYVICHEWCRIRLNYATVRAITPFKAILGHRVWYQSKARIRLPRCQQMVNVPNGVETFSKISIAWVVCTNVTDRQTGDDIIANVSYHVGQKTARFIFAIALSELNMLRQFLAHICFNNVSIIRIFHIL